MRKSVLICGSREKARAAGLKQNFDMNSPRIVLLKPPFPVHRAFVDFPFFSNLGMLQAAAVCRAVGIEVDVIDAFSQPDSAAREIDAVHIALGCDADRFIELVAELAPDITVLCGNPLFNLHARTPWLSLLLERLHRLKPGGKLVYADCHIGGAHFSDVSADAVRLKNPRIRHIVKYNAETQLPALLKSLVDNPQQSPQTLHGGLENIDFTAQPPPAWDLIDVGCYQRFLESVSQQTGNALATKSGARTLPAALSRGCLSEPIYRTCNPGDTRPVYKRLSESQTRALFESYRARGCDRIVILDDLPNPSTEIFDTVLALLDEFEFDYDFANGLRADNLTHTQIVRMQPHITHLRIDASFEPPSSQKSFERAAACCKEQCVPFEFDTVIGLPGESMEALNATLHRTANFRENFNAMPRVMFAVPLPGSKLLRECAAHGIPADETIVEFSPYYTQKPLAVRPKHAAAVKKALDNYQRLDFSDRIERVFINLTYKCSNRCAFCPVGDREQVHSEPADVIRALELYRKRGVTEVWFKGGEPAIHPQIFKLLNAAGGIGYERIGLATNARMAAFSTFAEKLITANPTHIEISLFGADARTHDAHTRAPGSFEQTQAGISNIMELKPNGTTVSLAITLTAKNIEELPEIAALAAKAGISKLIVQPLLPLGLAEKQLAPEPAAVSETIKKTIQSAPSSLTLRIRHTTPCLLPWLEDYLDDDLLLIKAHIVQFGFSGISVTEYLSSIRKKRDVCAACPYEIVCDGFYSFG